MLIDARLLHRQLKSGWQFADWISKKIKDFGFTEGQDFFSVKKGQEILITQKTEIKTQRGGDRKSVEYLLTLDMAKELAMLERSEMGKKIRRYFIEKEKQLRSISQLPRETTLFKGLKCKRINDRALYPYREVLVRCGYAANNNGDRRHRYWMHFVKDGTILYVTEEFAMHLYRQKQVLYNRAAMLACQPVLPLHFGGPIV